MRRILLCLIVFPFLISWDCRPAAPPVSVSNKPVSAGERSATKPLPEMSWTDSEQRVQKLGDLAGKAVILDFWATNCPPCRAEIPHLNSLLTKYGADNLQIRGLHVGDSLDRKEIPKFVSETKIDYPIAFPEDALSRFIFAERDDIPQTAVFDRKGQMITKIVGFSPAIQKELDAAVEQAMRTE